MESWLERLEKMRHNPKGDWRIRDIELVCDGLGMKLRARGSHHTVSHPSQREILTIPSHRTIKPVYIRRLVKFADSVKGGSNAR